MLDLVRAASLNNFVSVVEEFGGDPLALLHKVGISPKLLQEPEMFYPYYDFTRLMNLASYTLNQPSFGLYLGSKQGFEMFGPMGYLLKNCDTIGDALLNLRRYFHVHQTSADIGLSIKNELATLSFSLNINIKGHTVQAMDLTLAIGVHLLKTLSSSKVNLQSIHLQHAAPADKKRYKNHLGLTPIFNSTFNGIVFDASILECHIDEADPQLLSIFISQLDNDLGYVDEIPNFVEMIIRHHIAVTPINIEEVAKLMALSVRNLQRYLKEQDTSFRQIVDNVRNNLASRYLIDSTLTLNRVSDALGFSNYSEFSRAFKRWNKVSPKDFRNTHSPRKRLAHLKNL